MPIRQNPLISIIIPVRNGALFLKECLDSIINQSIEQWEVCITDDHSTDLTPSTLKTYARQDQRIKVYLNKGKGIIDALRTGYRYAKGDYVTRMDADDIMSPNKLELMVSALTDKQKSVAIGMVEYFRNDRPIGEGYERYAAWLNGLTLEGRNFDEIYKECSIPSPCWMMSRSDFESVDGFNSDIYPEDYDFAFRLALNNTRIVPVPTVVHLWRDHSDRASRNDPNYLDNRFLDIKVHYFLKLHRQTQLPLVIWGAGKKGKYLARKFKEVGIHFKWVTDNPKKLNALIYGIQLELDTSLEFDKKSQVIIAVAATEAQVAISEFTKSAEFHEFFWFC